jgi:hypothetical protein
VLFEKYQEKATRKIREKGRAQAAQMFARFPVGTRVIVHGSWGEKTGTVVAVSRRKEGGYDFTIARDDGKVQRVDPIASWRMKPMPAPVPPRPDM